MINKIIRKPFNITESIFVLLLCEDLLFASKGKIYHFFLCKYLTLPVFKIGMLFNVSTLALTVVINYEKYLANVRLVTYVEMFGNRHNVK